MMHLPLLVSLYTPVALGSALPWRRLQTADQPTPLQTRSDDRTLITDPKTGYSFVPGETSTNRTIYNAVALFCMIVLAVFLGVRAKTLRNNVLRKRNFTSMLIVSMFFFGLGFIVSASIVQTGQGLRTHKLCYASAMICLVFYTCNKLAIYVFLLERARIVRAPFMPRHKDYVWLIGLFIILGGFGSIAILGYLSPIVDLSKLDGRCRIGLPPTVSFPLLCFDVVINFLLTGVFFWLLRPVLELRGLMSLSNWCGTRFAKKIARSVSNRKNKLETDSHGNNANLQLAMNKSIKTLLLKCLIGSMLVMLPTVGNMAQFYTMNSRELGWVCLTICTLDVSWGVVIVNWLTIGSAEAESNLTTLMSQRTLYDTIDREVGILPIRDGETFETKDEASTVRDTASLKDEGGLLHNDDVSTTWREEVKDEVKEPERTYEGRSNTHYTNTPYSRTTL